MNVKPSIVFVRDVPLLTTTLAISGAGLAEVTSRDGWRNYKTAFYYLKLSVVLSVVGVSSALSSCDPSDGQSVLYSDLNNV